MVQCPGPVLWAYSLRSQGQGRGSWIKDQERGLPSLESRSELKLTVKTRIRVLGPEMRGHGLGLASENVVSDV